MAAYRANILTDIHDNYEKCFPINRTAVIYIQSADSTGKMQSNKYWGVLLGVARWSLWSSRSETASGGHSALMWHWQWQFYL